jgi:hypothetical protein
LLLVAPAALASCSRSCQQDHPYVPFAIDAAPPALPAASASAVSSEVHAATAASAPGSASAFPQVKAERAPDGATKVGVEGLAATAPAGRVFRSLLKVDIDGDARRDLVAWVQSPDAVTSEVLFFQGAGDDKLAPPVACATLPARFSPDAGCKPQLDLLQIGPRTALASAHLGCGPKPAAGSPRWIAVLSPARRPALRLELDLDPPAAGEQVGVAVDALDRDGDGLDDVTAWVTLSGATAPFEPAAAASSVELRYFDRPAGLSRDSHEPEASLQALAAKLVRLAKRKGSLREVAGGAHRLRRLHALVCAEAGAPLLRVGAAPLACGTGSSLADAAAAEIDAALRSSEPLTAVGLLSRLERGEPAPDARRATEIRARVEHAFASANAQAIDIAPAPSQPGSPSASWGILAFGDDGALSVRAADSVQRYDPRTGTAVASAPDAAGASAPWPLGLVSPDGARRVARAFDPCDGFAARVDLVDGADAGAGSVQVALPLAGPRPKGCAGGTGAALDLRPIAWGALGLEALVDDLPVGIASDLAKARMSSGVSLQPVAPGGPRSPDGRVIVHPCSIGLLVAGPGDKAALWKPPRPADGFARLRDCTVANGAAVVACVNKDRVVAYVPAGPDR